MSPPSRTILLCSCDDTMSPDAEGVARVCRGATIGTAHQLCRAELERFRAAAAQGGVPEAVKPFLTANAITTDILEKVFHPTGPGAKLLASDIPGTGKAGKMVFAVFEVFKV